jgi:inorganic pyrophosphatase
MNLKDISPGENLPEVVNAVIEIPKGSKNKYEYDPEMGAIRLDRVLHSAVFYPADYGFIPRTLSDDGDPLDILVLITESTFPGCVMKARPVGVLNMTDDKGIDEKIIAVAVGDPKLREIEDISDLDEHTVKEIANFFEIYKQLENKMVRVDGWMGKEDAHKVIQEAVARYR